MDEMLLDSLREVSLTGAVGGVVEVREQWYG